MRALAGLIAGLIAAVAAMIVVGFVGGLIVPMSASTDVGQQEMLRETLVAAPLGQQLVILISWFAAAFAGAAVAQLIARVAWPGWAIAGGLALLLAATFLVPLPVWMQALAVVGPLLGGLLADQLVRRRRAAHA